jgi:hypothetical protein
LAQLIWTGSGLGFFGALTREFEEASDDTALDAEMAFDPGFRRSLARLSALR